MKQIVILTLGSRGDVQPFIALSLGLKRAGFAVRIITYSKFEALVRSYGVDFFPIHNSYEAVLVRMLSQPSNPFLLTKKIEKAVAPILDKVLIECLRGSEGADLIVSSATSFWGFDIAEYLGVQHVLVGLLPLEPTKEFPHCAFPQININGFFNQLTAKIVSNTFWGGFKSSINKWRKETLGLTKWENVPFETKQWKNQLTLLAYSPTLLPQPSDWESRVHTTGFWFLDEPVDFTPDEKLIEFLSGPQKPIYIGFGSMNIEGKEKARWISIFSEALKKASQKGILSGKLGEEATPEDHIFCIDTIPHSWLFPRLSLIIHHGGIGTTGAAIRAGCPSVVVPFYSDQPFWARRLNNLGIAPEPIHKRNLSSENLANTIRQTINNSHITEKASTLGKKIRSEEGLNKAVKLIQYSMNTF